MSQVLTLWLSVVFVMMTPAEIVETKTTTDSQRANGDQVKLFVFNPLYSTLYIGTISLFSYNLHAEHSMSQVC